MHDTAKGLHPDCFAVQLIERVLSLKTTVARTCSAELHRQNYSDNVILRCPLPSQRAQTLTGVQQHAHITENHCFSFAPSVAVVEAKQVL